tara:strand:+ start:3563 stop:4426 length:864 start_codon:yes stop_codon:yes gene_type:complete
MPELPEVEIVKQSLDQKIKSKRIINIIIKNRNLRFKIPSNFENLLRNKIIKKITRYSKYLVLHLSDKTYWIIHLGMSGTIHLVNKNKKKFLTNTSFYNSINVPQKHNHVVIIFKDLKIIYNDPRRFGFFKLIKCKDDLNKEFSHLGPEPFLKEFNLKYIINYFKDKKKNIKNFLIDQSFVSGIGNIYANEILFLCKINPLIESKKLKKKQCEKIIYFSKLVLKKAIKKGGSSIKNFKNTSGNNGLFQTEFKVYQRENLNCTDINCKGKIKKIFVSKRSTFFCNKCQK